MTDQPAATPPTQQPKEPLGSGSWIPLIGSALIMAVMLGLIIAANAAK